MDNRLIAFLLGSLRPTNKNVSRKYKTSIAYLFLIDLVEREDLRSSIRNWPKMEMRGINPHTSRELNKNHSTRPTTRSRGCNTQHAEILNAAEMDIQGETQSWVSLGTQRWSLLFSYSSTTRFPAGISSSSLNRTQRSPSSRSGNVQGFTLTLKWSAQRLTQRSVSNREMQWSAL